MCQQSTTRNKPRPPRRCRHCLKGYPLPVLGVERVNLSNVQYVRSNMRQLLIQENECFASIAWVFSSFVTLDTLITENSLKIKVSSWFAL